mgnify:CR=1 FL=1
MPLRLVEPRRRLARDDDEIASIVVGPVVIRARRILLAFPDSTWQNAAAAVRTDVRDRVQLPVFVEAEQERNRSGVRLDEVALVPELAAVPTYSQLF